MGAATVCSCARLHHCCRPTGPQPAAARSTAAPALYTRPHPAAAQAAALSSARCARAREPLRSMWLRRCRALQHATPPCPRIAQRIAFDAASRALPCTAAAQGSWGWSCPPGVSTCRCWYLGSLQLSPEPVLLIAPQQLLAWRNLALLSVPSVSPALHRLRPAAAPRNRAAPARARPPAAPRAVSPCSQHHF